SNPHRSDCLSSSIATRAAELDSPATTSAATLFTAPLAPDSPFSAAGLGEAEGAPYSASSSSSSASPGGSGATPVAAMTTTRGLGMMGMSGGYADSLKILFSKPSGHEEVLSEDEARRRREQLNRRPSYRMILKDLETVDKTMKTEPEDSPPPASVQSSLGSTVDTTPGTSSNTLSGPGDSLHVQIPRSGLLPSTSSASSQQQLQSSSNGAMGSPYNSPLSNNLLLGQGLPLNGGDLSLGDLSYGGQINVATAAALVAAARNNHPQLTPNSAFEGSTGEMHTLKGMQDHSFSQGAAAAKVDRRRMFDEVAAQLGGGSNGHHSLQQQQNGGGASGSMNGGGQRGGAMTLRESLGGGAMLGEEDDFMERKGVDWTSSLMSSTGYSSSPSPTGGHGVSMGGEDESTRKRQVRLLKNREAAKECRRKKKEYVKCLENRVAVLENQNKALIEELKALKELYCRKEKSDM
ncbi:hypothetical protein PMAYCL1PPCAC_13211, partial [Pristionchus mayeri]